MKKFKVVINQNHVQFVDAEDVVSALAIAIDRLKQDAVREKSTTFLNVMCITSVMIEEAESTTYA